MVTLLRRFLVLVTLMFWLGGFTFYAGVVVPIGRAVLGGSMQSEVTRPVSHYLNVACAVALLPLAWDTWSSGDPSRRRRWARWLCWASIVSMLVMLYLLRVQMEKMLDGEAGPALLAPSFHTGHRVYLWVSTAQWAAGLGMTWLGLVSWRAEDKHAAGPVIGGERQSPVGDFPGVAQSPKSPADGTVRS